MQSPAELQNLYRSPSFLMHLPDPEEKFGVLCSEAGTVFSLWSPLAQAVSVLLYPDGTDSPCCRRLPMNRTICGVWRCAVPQNLHGTYYLFEITHDGQPVLAGDPYARSCGLNSTRCMAVDLSRTDPEGWSEDRGPRNQDCTVIYELHVKEFSWQAAGGFPADLRGKFRAFTCGHTTLHNDGVHPTGLDYLSQLGVTDLQLMPIFDYGSVDDADPAAFNWGYDPVYYNVPEGSYSSDPADGSVRIRECKEMIQALHRSGFRVIMDVVYNHTYHLDSCLNRCVPWYYYRLNADGTPANGSGCGNDLATEAPMCARMILDSVLYWAEEYHIDGFRFDLMGLMDVGLMNRIRAELDRIYGPGEKRIYGEPWSSRKTAMAADALPADKSHATLLHSSIGMFWDLTRDSIKGNVFLSKVPGFVNGGQGFEQDILSSVSAWCRQPPLLLAPSQQITYVSSHDNLTLWDKLQQTTKTDTDAMRCNRIAAAICMTCQGIPFFLSGEEFARTKNGQDNTYCAPIALNRLDWEKSLFHADLVSYYAGLIALRKQCPGLYDQSEAAPDRIFNTHTSPHTVRFCVHNESPSGTRWETLLVLYHAGSGKYHLRLPCGSWQLLATRENSLLWQTPQLISGSLRISGPSVLILGQ